MKKCKIKFKENASNLDKLVGIYTVLHCIGKKHLFISEMLSWFMLPIFNFRIISFKIYTNILYSIQILTDDEANI